MKTASHQQSRTRAAILLGALSLLFVPPSAALAQESAPAASAPAASAAPQEQKVFVEPAFNVFWMPQAFPAHKALLASFKKAMDSSDYAAMETISSNAVAIFPRDAVWRYNLACSKARRGHIDDAREAILAAASLGFSDADGAEADSDLAILRRDPAFVRALAVIRNNHDHPETVPGAAAPLAADGIASITVTNTIWDMEAGGFTTLFTPRTRSTLYAPLKTSIPGKTGEVISRWLSEGTASGNAGDIYDNHDRGHSRLDISLFSGLVATRYDWEAHDAGADTGYSLFTFPGRIVFGNSSTANTSGPLWSSSARRAQAEAPFTLFRQYLSNCIYVYPQHHDYLPSVEGDVFPCRTPYLFISPGSSWTDRPILASIATALAALRPETKDALAAQGRIAPTLQYLLRMAQTNVVSREDYLQPRAHPVIFDGKAIDTLCLAELAHAIETNALPPAPPMLRVIFDEAAKFVPGKDYPDPRSERVFDSPFAISRVWHATPYSRKMRVAAGAPQDTGVRYHWFVGQGDPDKIKIRELSPEGRDLNGRAVEITVEYHEPHFETPFGVKSCRVDIVCVADDGAHFSAPSFVSWYFPPVEKRVYDASGHILEIDYGACKDAYVDPSSATHFPFLDIFMYGINGAQSRRRIPDDSQD